MRVRADRRVSGKKNVSDVTTTEIWGKNLTQHAKSDSTGRSIKHCLKPCFLRLFKWAQCLQADSAAINQWKTGVTHRDALCFEAQNVLNLTTNHHLVLRQIMSCQLSENLLIVIGVMMTQNKKWKIFDEGLASQAKIRQQKKEYSTKFALDYKTGFGRTWKCYTLKKLFPQAVLPRSLFSCCARFCKLLLVPLVFLDSECITVFYTQCQDQSSYMIWKQ